MIAWLLLLAQAPAGPWDKYQHSPNEGRRVLGPHGQQGIIRNGQIQVIPDRLGPGAHTLMVSDGQSFTRVEYKSGTACQKARDLVRRQVAPPPDTRGTIYGPPTVKAFCVPR